MEQYIAEKANQLSNMDVSNIIPIDNVLNAIAEYECLNKDELPTGLAEAQKQAVISSVYSPLLLISGGAGTGKTTVLRCIYHVLEKHGTSIAQMALAGRAAKRMQDATDKDAYTIAGYLKAHENNPDKLLGNTCIVVDESSMVDLLLAYRVIKTMNINCRLIMVGDPVQLAPIGPGLIFHLLVKTKGIEHVELTEIKRQKDSTGIPVISKSIRNHVWPSISSYIDKCDGVSVKQCAKSYLRDTVISIFDELGGCNDDARIIAPTYSHPSGVTQLNQSCQEKYRKDDKHISYWDETYECNINTGFKVNDYVMWLKNDYSRDLRNGSLGIIKEVLDGQDGYVCKVDFEGNELKLKIEDMVKETLTLAYCITAHKAQGSQFNRVIIPIYQWNKLDQSWIYTALTRSVKQAVLVGDIKYARERVRSKSSADNRTVGLETLLQLAFKH